MPRRRAWLAEEVRNNLLKSVGAEMIALKRENVRKVLASSDMLPQIDVNIDRPRHQPL